MLNFRKVFHSHRCSIIGMIHVPALPGAVHLEQIRTRSANRKHLGTPLYDGNFNTCIERVRHEANIYKQCNVDAVMVENMHDIPYVQQRHFQPETVACMTRLAHEMRSVLPQSMPCGIQVLACGNAEALAIAKATGLQFIRAEGFVFAHIADEGFTDACAGQLLRYRKHIEADDVLVLTDIKKKHSSHAITADLSLRETAKMAGFFRSDGLIVTGTETGDPVALADVESLTGSVDRPILIGSGVTADNLHQYHDFSDGLIVGSYFKRDGNWVNELCPDRIRKFMDKVQELRVK